MLPGISGEELIKGIHGIPISDCYGFFITAEEKIYDLVVFHVFYLLATIKSGAS